WLARHVPRVRSVRQHRRSRHRVPRRPPRRAGRLRPPAPRFGGLRRLARLVRGRRCPGRGLRVRGARRRQVPRRRRCRHRHAVREGHRARRVRRIGGGRAGLDGGSGHRNGRPVLRRARRDDARMIGTLSPAGLPTAMTGLPLDALADGPRLLGAALPAASAPAAPPPSASPATADDWFGVVDGVSRNWSGESADSAVASLTRAATGASVLDGNADVIDAAILVGTGAIVVAAADLAVLAAEFLTTAATTVAASAALGPAGLLPAATGLQTEATATLTAAVARLAQLESELAAPTSILESTVSTDVDLPAPP